MTGASRFLTAVVAGARAEVDDPVGVGHDRLVVLDDDHRLAGVDEPVEQAEQLLQLDDTLPTLAADPDTIRDAVKAVGEDTQVTGERQQP